jgi:hypothetical protein
MIVIDTHRFNLVIEKKDHRGGTCHYLLVDDEEANKKQQQKEGDIKGSSRW